MNKKGLISIFSAVMIVSLFCFMPDTYAAKSVEVQKPNGGENLQAGKTATIRWKSSGLTGKVRVILRKGNRVVKKLHKPGGEPKKGTLSWKIPDDFATGNDYKIVVRGLGDEASVVDRSDRNFSIRPASAASAAGVAGEVQVTSPARGDTLETGDRTTIWWRKRGMTGKVRVVLRKGGRFLENLSPPGGAPNNGKFYWTIPDSIEAGTDYKIRVRGIGDEASIMDDSDGKFTIVKRARETTSTASPGGTSPVTSGISTAPAAQKPPVWQGSSTRTINTGSITMTGIGSSSAPSTRTINTGSITMTGIGNSSETGPAKKKPVPMKKSSGK